MTSPYAIRSRRTPSLCQIPDLTPKTSTRQRQASGQPQQKTIHNTEKTTNVRQQTLRSKSSKYSIAASEQQAQGNNFSSNCLNESSNPMQKSQKSSLNLEQPNQNQSGVLLQQNLFPKSQELIDRQPNNEHQSSFFNQKKSYRKQHSRHILCVPYRKCHSSMEEKVVSIINKIKNNKECQKQIQALLDKAKKVSIKELSNRYFISGIVAIHRLLDTQNQVCFDKDITLRIQSCLNQLKKRIQEELDCTKGYETQHLITPPEPFCKNKVVKRAYKILRKKMRSQAQEVVQQKAIYTADWFLGIGSNNLHLLFEQLANC